MEARVFQAENFSKMERQVTVVALMMVFLLGALDQTIVSTAMPTIVAQLQGLQLYAWVTTAYLLTSTVVVPIWGKLSDIYGRKAVLVAGISIFIIGSCLSGLAGEFGDLPLLGGGMIQLVVFRGIQGLGGGALFTSAFTIIADLYSPRDRSKVGGLFGSMFATASVLGPIVGGFFTDHGSVRIFGQLVEGWRWIFYINLPLSAAALFMILVKMPRIAHHGDGRIDFLGAALLVVAFVPLLLALTWGGQTYPWSSPPILGLLAVSAVALIGFVFAESRASDPLVPLGLFTEKTFSTANIAAFVVSMAFMGAVTFLPLYMQIGQGVAATSSGLAMIPLTIGVVVGASGSGLIVSKTGRYRPLILLGGVVMSLGLGLMIFIGPETSMLDLSWRLLILGLGLGPSQSLTNLAVQNAAAPRHVGVVTSTSQFLRQIGGLIGVALMGAVLTQSMTGAYARLAPPAAAGAPAPVLDLGKLRQMAMESAPSGPAKPQAGVLTRLMGQVVSIGVADTFKAATILSLLALLVALAIPRRTLDPHRIKDSGPPAH